MTKLTRQGIPDLNNPRNGKRELRTGSRRPKPRFHGVCDHHEWRMETDEFGDPTGYTCYSCGAWSSWW